MQKAIALCKYSIDTLDYKHITISLTEYLLAYGLSSLELVTCLVLVVVVIVYRF
jgi:hypothetical protein